MSLRLVFMIAAVATGLAAGSAGAQPMTPEPWTPEQAEKVDLPLARKGDVDAQILLARNYEARPAGDAKRGLAADYWGVASVSGRPETLDALLRLARGGDVRAQTFLGRALMVRGAGKDRAAGLDWLRRAGDAGAADANFALGCLLGVSPNRAERAEAMVRLDRAGKADPKLAALAALLSAEIGPRNVRAPWPVTPAARVRQELGLQWSPDIQRRSLEHWGLAQMSSDIPAVLAQTRTAGRLFEVAEAAQADDPAAQILLHWEMGRRCSDGKVLVRSACAAYQRAWPRNLGQPLSNYASGAKPVVRMLDAGRMFELGVGGPKDPELARAYYQQLDWSRAGPDALEASWRLYLMEIGNVGVKGDPQRAHEYLFHAESGGHPMANYVRAQDCEAKADFDCAAVAYRRAADGKITDAAYRYAQMLADQKVIVRNGPAHIYQYFRMAALGGDIRGFDGVARAYWNGWGVPQDTAQAEEWYQRGARAGDPRAAWAAGNLAGRRGDWPGSIPWYRLAAQGGYPGAQEKLQSLAANGWHERSLGGFLMTMLDYAGAVAEGMEQARQYQIAVQEEQIRESIMICQACSAGSGAGAPGTSSGASSGSPSGSSSSSSDSGSTGSDSNGSSGSGSAGPSSGSAGGPGGDGGGPDGGAGAGSGGGSGGGHMWGEPAEGSGSAWSASGSGEPAGGGTSSASGSGGSAATGAIIVDDGGKAERARIARREAQMQAEAARLKALSDAENDRLRAQNQADEAKAAARRKAKYERYAIACYGSLEAAKTAKVSCE